ncbi:MAG: phytoene/squalene synthase family protein [Candidatus Thiothrix sulfatifontis]|nr:MAG: phytoene/squalene synthase family protein [Candidatus Thiothrix sulfatifontis]
METPALNPLQVLRKHGKTFYFASHLLGKTEALRCARLYAFCRYIDDIADESPDKVWADQQLADIYQQIEQRQARDVYAIDFLALAAECEFSPQPALELIKGVRGDLQHQQLRDEQELMHYCYRVAGTVGLMICGVLGMRDPTALPFAIDLGIAMQLTNIARDIKEDAAAERVYLPVQLIGAVQPQAISEPDAFMQAYLKIGIACVLDKAEEYYESAEHGLGFLPWRSRLAILVASRLYRAIGLRLCRQQLAFWQGRTVVPVSEKLLHAATACGEFVTRPVYHQRSHPHQADLHRTLHGLFGTNTRQLH